MTTIKQIDEQLANVLKMMDSMARYIEQQSEIIEIDNGADTMKVMRIKDNVKRMMELAFAASHVSVARDHLHSV